MTQFRWLWDPRRFRRFDDSFARNRQSKLAGLRQAIGNRRHSDQVLILVAHFAETFTILQNAIESWNIDYEVVTTNVDSNWLTGLDAAAGQKPVYLTLAQMLAAENIRACQYTTSPQLGVIVIDLHPLPEKDLRLEQFCRLLPYPVELGYFLSFDDIVVRQAVSDNCIRILDLFGMGENELITSIMISRQLKKHLAQKARHYSTDHAAASASEWFIANKPTV